MSARTNLLGGALAALLLAGCASYDGSSLVAGKSTARDVEALMGAPDGKLSARGGSSQWFYTRPSAGQSFAVHLSRDGVVRGVEQTLTEDNVARLRSGASTRDEVRALLGPPHFVSQLDRQQREVWEYKRLVGNERFVLWVQFSDDGVAREVLSMLDRDYIPASANDGAKD